MKTLTFPFGSDCKFTIIPKLGEQVLKEADMVDMKIKVINRNRGVDFEPEWAWRDTGIEIEIQREHIKFIGSYQLSIDWRRPDQSYSDNFQDILNSCTVIDFVDSCKVPEEDTAVIEVSPEYKGDKGDSAYQVWLESNTGTIEDYFDWLQKPATDAAKTAIEAAEEASEAKSEAEQAAEYATEQGDYAKEQAEIIEGYELIESEEYLETIFNDI